MGNEHMKRPVIIGCGNMGSALVEALQQREIYEPEAVTIIEKTKNRYTNRFLERGYTILKQISEFQNDIELVVLAVKPQDAKPLLKALASKVSEKTLVISIMAGISLTTLESELKQTQIIRCMPNIPCAIQIGMTVFCGNALVTEASLQITKRILTAMGEAIQVKNERMIDAATAISGSGPAYVFYLAEALKEGALRLGFDEDEAGILAMQTLLGAATLLSKSGESPEELRKKVTSPGGTTEAALTVYKTKGLKDILTAGFQAAFERSIQLGKS